MIERSKPVSDSLYLGRFLQLASEPVPVGDLKALTRHGCQFDEESVDAAWVCISSYQ